MSTGYKKRFSVFALFCGFFRSDLLFEVFFELVFTLTAFDKKWECSPSADWTEIFSPQVRKNYLRFSIVHDCSFVVVLILDRACPFWSGCEIKCFCCITGTIIIYSVHRHDFESRNTYNSGNSHISLGTFSLHLLTEIVLVATNSSVCNNYCMFSMNFKDR